MLQVTGCLRTEWRSDSILSWQYVDPIVEELFGNGQPNRTIVTLPLVTKKGDFSRKSQPKSQDKGQASKASMMEARKEKVLQMIKNGEYSTVPAIASEGSVPVTMKKR